MRLYELFQLLDEAPLQTVPAEKQDLYRQAWQSEYIRPGELWTDVGDTHGGPDDPFGDDLHHFGSGAEALVVQHHNEPGVVKILGTYRELGQNAHLQYLLATRKYHNSNPYFPRFSSVQFLQHPSAREPKVKGYVIRMEKLYDLATCSSDQLLMMLEKIYSNEALFPFLEGKNKLTAFAGYVKAGVISSKRDQVIDPAFIQARDLIISVGKRMPNKYGLASMVDLHSGNMMVRRTQVGPQLVITDPLFNADGEQ